MSAAHRVCAALALLLTGCAGTGAWTKAGTDATASAREVQDCREVAGTAVKTDADIDQDILATRQNDWQRAGVVRTQTRVRDEATRDRAAAIIAACMQAKGFKEPR